MLVSSIGRSESIEIYKNILDDELFSHLQNSIDVDYQDENGWTALHYAAFFRQIDVMDALIKIGANPEVKTKSNEFAGDLYRYAIRYP